MFGIASGLVLATFVYGGWTRRMARVLAPIGLVSYGVYLWHWVILSALIHHGISIVSGTGLAATGVRMVALVLLTLPVAAASWLLIERPLLRRTAGWERRSNAREAARSRREPAGRAQAPLPASLAAVGQTPSRAQRRHHMAERTRRCTAETIRGWR